MGKQDLYLDCLRRTVEVYRRGTFNRHDSVAIMATCIDIQMRQDPADDKTGPVVRDAGAVARLELAEPLNADDQVLQELYAEASTFWAAGFGKLKLVK